MPVTRPTDGEYVCHGVTWATGNPRLLLAPLPGGPLVYAEIMHQRLGLAIGTGRWCTGRYQFADTVRVEAVACPDRAPTGQNDQCARCFRQDEFRFAHQFHQDGHAPEALRQYMDQSHWLYLATFADGATKVGTAGEHGFTIVSCVGTQVLAVLGADDGVDYVLDLGALKGRRISLGPFASPAAAVQISLF